MFPEADGEDDTAETNNEERDLHTVIREDHNNEIYFVLSSFIPCLGQWEFSWVETIAMPYFIPHSPFSHQEDCHRCRPVIDKGARGSHRCQQRLNIIRYFPQCEAWLVYVAPV